MTNERLIEKISRFLYKRLYNRYKYKALFQSRLFKVIALPLYSLFNFFYYPCVLRFYMSHVAKLAKGTEVMIMGRRDFGTHLWGLHYARMWKYARSPVCLLVFTNENAHIKQLAKVLLPEVDIVYPDRFFDHLVAILFGHQFVFSYTLMRVYAHLAIQRPDFIHIWDLADSPYARYNEHLDPLLQDPTASSFNKDFLDAYKAIRAQWDYRWDTFEDSFKLNYSTSLPKIGTNQIIDRLKKDLNIDRPYVILNFNTKIYPGAFARRTIKRPEKYNCLIDALIQKGFDVVLHGRKEQPSFKARKGFIDYAKSSFCKIENDLALFVDCEFVITNKSGVELFSTMCNAPVLGLDYTELLSMQPSKKMRFYPKSLRDLSTGKIFSWQEHLAAPHFFHIGDNTYGVPIDYIEMEEEEMIEALDEFIPLVVSSTDRWVYYTETQKKFRASLSPLHLDLFLAQVVPCDSYLKRNEQQEQ